MTLAWRWLACFSMVLPLVVSAVKQEQEPAWGRLYLRHGLAPIQYFRDGNGAPMVPHEVEFYFPTRDEDRYGCELLPEDDQRILQTANGSIALVLDRGVCTFEVKARNAERMGAAALVIVSYDESARGPVAPAAQGDVSIASVMIRKSGGDLLRHLSQHQAVAGRLIPMLCQKTPYRCHGRSAADNAYIAANTVRSGVILSHHDATRIGEFLAATFGGILPVGPLHVTVMASPDAGCSPLDHQVERGLVLYASTTSRCSPFERISNAQHAGALAAFVTMAEGDALDHPAVETSWHAYNITLAAGSVSTATSTRMTALLDEMSDAQVDLRVHNEIAEAWNHIRSLATRAAWPMHELRKQQVVERLLAKLTLDDGQLDALQHHFISIAGGKTDVWEQLVMGRKAAATDGTDRDEL